MKSSDIRLNKLKVQFVSAPIADIEGEIARELKLIQLEITPGMCIAVTVGSRGISNIALIVKTVAGVLKSFGAKPFIVPAMGSHGGATAEGQKMVLKTYGVTEEEMGVPILSSMEVVHVGILPGEEELPLYMDKYAFESDGVFVINRVKAHTDFHGSNESGIAEISIGLGKHAQALAAHGYLASGLRQYIPRIAHAIIETGKVIGALAIVEDGCDRTSIIRAVKARDIVTADAELLIQAKKMMPSIPFEQVDVMMVDRMGKNISGTGMDTNIIGRVNIRGEADTPPYSTNLCLFDLTPESHGNGLGVGLADLIPQRLADKIDWKVTYENVLTSRFVERGFLPVTLPIDRDVVDTALRICGHITEKTLRLIRIRDTLHIDEIFVTDPLWEEVRGNSGIELLEKGIALSFSIDGVLKKL
jgi:hypothetical protein